jgi:hypothetical protein
MYYELEMLETLADWLKKQRSVNRQDALLHDETKRLEKVMLHQLITLTNRTQLSTYLQVNLYKLGEICDQLYDLESKDNANAAIVLELLIAIRKTVVAIAPQDQQLPLLLRKIRAEYFSGQWLSIRDQLYLLGTDSLLIDIIAFPFDSFVHSKVRPKWSNETYLLFFADALEELPDKTDADYSSLILLLIRLGYNHSRFTAYCYRWIRLRYEGKGRKESLNLLLAFRKELRQLELLNAGSFDPRKQPAMEELLKWIDEELAGLSAEQHERPANPMKLNTQLKVLELAYWQKLQRDHGVYDEINLDVLSEKIAYNFSSKFQEELSAASIKSKFYPKDRSVIEPIEEILVKMLEDVRQFLR